MGERSQKRCWLWREERRRGKREEGRFTGPRAIFSSERSVLPLLPPEQNRQTQKRTFSFLGDESPTKGMTSTPSWNTNMNNCSFKECLVFGAPASEATFRKMSGVS